MIIQFLSRDSVTRPVAFILIVALFFWSCTPKVEKSRDGAKPAFSGEELFSGILFADGKVADMLPEIKRIKELIGLQSLNNNQKAAVKRLQDTIIYRINKMDPEYFRSFQYSITSGNQVVITAAIRNASALINNVLLTSNKGLSQILDDRENRLLMGRFSASKKFQALKNHADSASLTSDASKSFLNEINRDVIIDRDILINRITDIHVNKYIDLYLNRDININRFIDVNYNQDVSRTLSIDIDRNFDLDFNKNFAINRSIDVFRFLDIDKNIQRHFDRVNINVSRSVDAEFNPFADVTVDIETAIYAVVAVAVFVVAVAAWVVGRQDILNDKGGIFKEQLVNSIAINLNVQKINTPGAIR